MHTEGTVLLQNIGDTTILPNTKKLLNTVDYEQTSAVRFYSTTGKVEQGAVNIDVIYGKLSAQIFYITQGKNSAQ